MPQKRIVVAEEQDWHAFLTLAAAEGWRVPDNEIAFHRQQLTTALALRHGEETLGFVTAVLHRQSGWIGNLLVAPALRGAGFGGRLFDLAQTQLRRQGATSLWLTASAQGAPLYRRRGFVKVGEVGRWVRRQGGDGSATPPPLADIIAIQADAAVWGERRAPLLRFLAQDGQWCESRHCLALLQQTGSRQIIGPWLAMQAGSDPKPLLTELVALAEPGRELLVDAIAHAATARALHDCGFVAQGRTELMVCGSHAALFQRLLALASLGSIG